MRAKFRQRVKKGALPAAPAKPAVPSAPRDLGPREERVKMTKLRQVIATRLKEAQNSAAMLTTFNEVDMQPIMDLRKSYQDAFVKKHGIKLGIIILVLRFLRRKVLWFL